MGRRRREAKGSRKPLAVPQLVDMKRAKRQDKTRERERTGLTQVMYVRYIFLNIVCVCVYFDKSNNQHLAARKRLGRHLRKFFFF